MAHDIDQLLVAPHVLLQRCNVEITGQDRRTIDRFRPFGHPAKKSQLLSELGIVLQIRNFAACRNIDIVEPDAFGCIGADFGTDMPRFAIGLPVLHPAVEQRQFADNSYTVMHRLTVDHHMAIAELAEQPFGKQAVDDLGFLQT